MHTIYKGNFAKVILLTLIVPIILLGALAAFSAGQRTSEPIANIISSLCALACWGIAGWFLFAKIFGKRFFLILTALILLRIIANLAHFYFVFGPLAGIESSDALPYADFPGDLGAIFISAILFIDKFQESGIWNAIVGDYYRGINNAGVAVIFGGLFSAFGAYGTVAIPWTVIYSAFASLLIGLIGLSLRLPVSLCRSAILLVFFMPGFFIFPPIYRDNFVIYLLALSAYTAILTVRGSLLIHWMALLLESILLYSLRRVYLIIPSIFGIVAMNLNSRSKNRISTRGIVFGILVLLSIVVSWKYLSSDINQFSGLFALVVKQKDTYPILSPFLPLGPFFFFPAAAIFALLAPMPWWQAAQASLLSYQVFFYAQAWYALTVLVALFYSFKRKLMPTGGLILVTFFMVIFFIALFGSPNFGASYFQIGFPFVLLASIRYLSVNWKKCLAISTVIFALAHVALLVR